MRIAMIAHSNAPWTPHYARFGQTHGHEVLLISIHLDPVRGVRTIFVGREPYRDDRHKHLFLTKVPTIRKILRAFSPDVVFAPYLISNGLAASLAWRGPLVVSARGADVIEQAGQTPTPGWLMNWLVRFVCRRARVVHAVSDELVEALTRYGVDREKIHCFPMGVDTIRFAPAEGEGSTRAVGTPHIICTRRHDAVYDNHVIVEALAMMKSRGVGFRCTFVGAGRYLEERRDQVKVLGLADDVRFTSHVEHDQVPSLLRSANIYVSASSSDGTSSSLLEALATGVFPVVTRIRANEAWVRNGETGLFFEVGHAAGLAEALGRAINDARLREQAVTINRGLVERKGSQGINNRRLMDLFELAAGARVDSAPGKGVRK